MSIFTNDVTNNSRRHKTSVCNHLFKNSFILALSLTVLFLNSAAFSQQHSDNNQDQTLRGSGRVNLSTLGLEINIPLGNYPGRGINVPVSINYSSKVWRTEYINSQPRVNNPDSCIAINTLKYADKSASGWTSSLSVPYIEYSGKQDLYDVNGHALSEHCSSNDPNAPAPTNLAFIKRIRVHLPGGESHELRAGDAVHILPRTSNPGLDFNGTYFAADSSNIKYIENAAAGSYVLQMPDGSRYEFAPVTEPLSGNEPIQVRKALNYSDRNGNATTFENSAGTLTDTIGRTFHAPFDLNGPSAPTTAGSPQVYSLPGINGTAVNYKFHWKRLNGGSQEESAMTDITSPQYLLKYAADRSSNNPAEAPRESGTYLFGSIWEGWVIDQGAGLFNPVVLTEIELPTGVSYRFYYDNHGRIEQMQYPTGAVEKYTYNVVPGLAPSTAENVSDQTNFGITKREVFEKPLADSSYIWEFSAVHVAPAGLKITSITPEKIKTERFLHQGSTAEPGLRFGNFGFENVLAGNAYEERVYDKLNKLTMRKLTHWDKTSRAIENAGASPYRADWHPRVSDSVRLVYDGSNGVGLSARQSFGYAFESELGAIDTPVLQSTVSEFDFSATGNAETVPALGADPDPMPTPVGTPASANLIRTTRKTYLIEDTAIPQFHKQVYKDKNIVGLITAVEVLDSDGNTYSRSLVDFDEAGRSPEIGRGNETRTRSWDSFKGGVNDPEAYIGESKSYDNFGNVVSHADALGNTTNTVYDAAHSVFPVRTLEPLADADGSNGAFDQSVQTTEFDASTGLVLSTTSANNIETRIEFEPGTFRPIRKSQYVDNTRIGAITETVYDDTPLSSKVTTRKQITENTWSEVVNFYDGLGRVSLTENVRSDGSIFAAKEFDSDGRISRYSYPYRAGEERRWTTNEYDDLGRVISISAPDGTSITTDFGVLVSDRSGTTKTVTDQAGHSRLGIADALGRTISVVEDPSGQNLKTDYIFDVGGQIRETRQGEQRRYFLYDSLGRLRFSKQPEQDSNPSHSATDPITGNASWADRYDYDDNGNITELTNARGLSATASFDGLNRIVKRSFSDDTPDVEFFYDGTGLGRRPAGSRGKTTRVVSSVSDNRNLAFDEEGRVLEYEQFVGNQAYRGSYEYNLSGQMIAETYPSGRRTEFRLDPNGDLESVLGTKQGNSSAKTYLGNLERNSSGQVEKARLGNGKWQTSEFNSRDQITRVTLGSSTGDDGLLDLALGYGEGNNGSIAGQTISFNGLDGEISQSYQYDSLNRLVSTNESNGRGISWQESFEYDRYGNREINPAETNTLAVFDKVTNPSVRAATNRLISDQDADSTPDYVYDAAGNLTRDAEGKRYVYDAENRVSSYFKTGNSSSDADAAYQYDGLGRRVRKVSAEGQTVFVYNAFGKLVAEYGDNSPHSPSIRYLTKDHLGSTRVLTDGAGVVVKREDYLAFGESLTAKLGDVSGRSGVLGYGASESTRQQYTGYERDEESSLDFAQARYYNSGLGRFTSVDPMTASANLKNPQTFNRYSYGLNSPHKFVDPLGLISQGTGACGQYCSNVIGGGYNGGTIFDRMTAAEWIGNRELEHKPSAETEASETVTPPKEGPIEAPQPIIAEATNRLTDVTVTGGGIAETEGILQISEELNEIWISALNSAFDRGVRVGAAAKASNGEAVVSSMTQGASLGGSVSVSGNLKGAGVSTSGSGGKNVSVTKQVAGIKAINMDIDARAANTVTAQGAAGELQGQLVDVSTAGGTVQAEMSYGFVNKSFTRELDLIYRRGVQMGFQGTRGPYLTVTTTIKPK